MIFFSCNISWLCLPSLFSSQILPTFPSHLDILLFCPSLATIKLLRDNNIIEYNKIQ